MTDLNPARCDYTWEPGDVNGVYFPRTRCTKCIGHPDAHKWVAEEQEVWSIMTRVLLVQAMETTDKEWASWNPYARIPGIPDIDDIHPARYWPCPPVPPGFPDPYTHADLDAKVWSLFSVGGVYEILAYEVNLANRHHCTGEPTGASMPWDERPGCICAEPLREGDLVVPCPVHGWVTH